MSALGDACRAWIDSGSPIRHEAVARVHAVTGYDTGFIDRHLCHLFGTLSGDPLATLTGGPDHPSSPRSLITIASGNIPGAWLPPVVAHLIAGGPCLVKCSSSEPVMPGLFFDSLRRHAPELATRLMVASWSGGDRRIESALLPVTGSVAVYGDDATLTAIRRLAPRAVPFIEFGHRLSAAWIGAEAFGRHSPAELANRLAGDLAVFDGQGCLSPQLVLVEDPNGDRTPALVEQLAGALTRLESEHPLRPLSAAEAAGVHSYRASIAMRSLSADPPQLRMSQGGVGWTIVVDPHARLVPTCLNRTAILRPIHRPDEALNLLEVAGRSLGIVAAEGLGEAEAVRLREVAVRGVCSLGEAQFPTSPFQHDGVDLSVLFD